MINSTTISKLLIRFPLILFGLLVLCSSELKSQYINIQIELEPEFETEILSELNFGDIVVGTGEKNIRLGDSNMGIFSVTGINSQHIRLSLDTPESLTHSNPAVSDNIPFDIQASFNNSGENDIRGSEPFTGNFAYTNINENATRTQFEWETLYVYVYGTIFVGNITDGVYNGFIRLTVDYE